LIDAIELTGDLAKIPIGSFGFY